ARASPSAWACRRSWSRRSPSAEPPSESRRTRHRGEPLTFLESLKTGFSRTFWVANVIELFERFAYYGSKAILAVYIAEQVGLGPEAGTFLAGSVFNT